MPTYGILQCLQKDDGTYIVSVNGETISQVGPRRRDVQDAANRAGRYAEKENFFKGEGSMFGAILCVSFDSIWKSADVVDAVNIFLAKHGKEYPMKYVVILTKEGKAVYAPWLRRRNKSAYMEAEDDFSPWKDIQ